MRRVDIFLGLILGTLYLRSFLQLNAVLLNENEGNSPGQDSAAACLLTMDDNHFLAEWIPFHYYTFNLRHVIIAVDPRSRTSPNRLLKIWAEQGISTTTWSDADYMDKSELEVAKNWVTRKFGELNPELTLHRARQRLFYYKCMREHKRNGRAWTLLTDTDEFLQINYKTLKTNGINIPSDWEEPGRTLRFLQWQEKLGHKTMFPKTNWTTPCVQIPRIRYGAKESDTTRIQETLPTDINSSLFMSLRFRHHADPNNNMANRLSKAIVDLSRLSWADLEPVVSIHRPVWNQCGQRKRFIKAYEQALVINHYLGTWEQYSFRDDSRKGEQRSLEEYNKAQRFGKRGEVDEVVDQTWLNGFVNKMGVKASIKLLKDVGIVDKA